MTSYHVLSIRLLSFCFSTLSGDQLVSDVSKNDKPEKTACDSQIFGVLSKLQISSNY